MVFAKNFLIENNCLREFLIFCKSDIFALSKASFFKKRWLIVFSTSSSKIAILFGTLAAVDFSFGLLNIVINLLISFSAKELLIKSKALLSIAKTSPLTWLYAVFCPAGLIGDILVFAYGCFRRLY